MESIEKAWLQWLRPALGACDYLIKVTKISDMTKTGVPGVAEKRVITESRATNAPASSSLIRKSYKKVLFKVASL